MIFCFNWFSDPSLFWRMSLTIHLRTNRYPLKIDAWKMIFDVLLNVAPNLWGSFARFLGCQLRRASTAHRFAQQEFCTNSLKNESAIGSLHHWDLFFESAGLKRIYEIYWNLCIYVYFTTCKFYATVILRHVLDHHTPRTIPTISKVLVYVWFS